MRTQFGINRVNHLESGILHAVCVCVYKKIINSGKIEGAYFGRVRSIFDQKVT